MPEPAHSGKKKGGKKNAGKKEEAEKKTQKTEIPDPPASPEKPEVKKTKSIPGTKTEEAKVKKALEEAVSEHVVCPRHSCCIALIPYIIIYFAGWSYAIITWQCGMFTSPL